MVFFSIDSEIPFEEWEKTIYHHAHAFVPSVSEPAKLYAVAQRLLEEARRHEAAGEYDTAYFFVVKCLQVFDKEKVGVDIRQQYPEARKCMLDALDAHTRLRAGGLKKEYATLLQQLHADQQRRDTTVAHQLENDPSVDPGENAHVQRRQQLLTSEQNEIDALRAQLGGGGLSAANLQAQTTSSPQLVPSLYGNYSTSGRGTMPTMTAQPAYPTAQYGGNFTTADDSRNNMYTSTYASDYSSEADKLKAQIEALRQENNRPAPTRTPFKPRYERWRYNIGNFPTTAPRRGIVNLGNTCYMNSVLQVINATPLGNYFMGNEYQGYLVSKGGSYVKVTNAFIYVIRELRRQGCNFAVSASAFRSAIGEAYEPFRSSSQQDANEFLRVLLDSVHSALNERGNATVRFAEIDNTRGTDEELSRKYWAQYIQKNSSTVSEYCAFQERSLIVCPSCGQTSRSFATAFGVEVPIAKKTRISIEDCLDAYTAKEVLDQDSLYSCDGCKKKVRATKRLQFYSTPKMLFITLKRFRAYGDFSNVAKVNDEVFFERALDLSPYMCSNFSKTEFNLVGVVKHTGNMHGGHYTSDVLGPDKVWCNFSDERVVRGDEPDFRQAYILCYARVG